MSDGDASRHPSPFLSPVVVGYDGRPQGRDALALGASLARTLDAPLIVAAVYPSEDVVSSLPAEEHRARADRLAREGVDELAGVLDARPYPVAGRSPAHGLHELAEAEGAAALAVGSSQERWAACSPATSPRSCCRGRRARWRSHRAGSPARRCRPGRSGSPSTAAPSPGPPCSAPPLLPSPTAGAYGSSTRSSPSPRRP